MPPVPDVPSAPSRQAAHPHHHIAVSVDGTVDGGKLSEADKARIDAAVAQANARMEAIGPEIERAIQQAHVDEDAARSVELAMPKVRAAIAQAMSQIQPAIRKALADAKVDAQVSAARDKVQVEVDTAVTDTVRDGPHPHVLVHVRVPQPPEPPEPPESPEPDIGR
jgi:hypothetical protein